MTNTQDDSTVRIGKYGQDQDYRLDVATLIDTRLLINAASGGGKSYLLRRIIELLASRVQVIIIDPEGEFASLREKFDMLLVGKGGEIEPEIRTARALARKLAELRVSAIIDLYDIGDWSTRAAYVAPFIDGLMTLPKALYHPMLVAIDEAHRFAPEGEAGKAGSPTSASRAAIRAMMSAGRKRAICGALATQRMSKMDKDSIADAKNLMIGGQTLDIDMRRSADILGMDKDGRLSLRDMVPGEFWAFGPALPRGVNNFIVDPVITTHPKAGQRHLLEVPPASKSIQAIVASLADLPQKSVEDATALEGAQAEIKRLRLENAEARKELGGWMAEATRQPAEIRVPAIEAGALSALGELVKRAEWTAGQMVDGQRLAAEHIGRLADMASEYNAARDGIQRMLDQAQALLAAKPSNGKGIYPTAYGSRGRQPSLGTLERPANFPAMPDAPSGATLNKSARAVLTILAQRGLRTKRQVAIQSGYAMNGGAFISTLKALADLGYTYKHENGALEITNLGRKALGPVDALPIGQAIREYWLVHPSLTLVARACLRVLMDKHPEHMTMQILAEYAARASGKAEPYSHKGGAFIDAIRILRGLGLVEGPAHALKCPHELF